MSNTFIANIDGSHHTKSGISGWGFILYKNGQSIHSDYGKVDQEFITEFEYVAFAHMLNYVCSQKISKIHVKTDLLNMEKRFNRITLQEIFKIAQRYIPSIVYHDIEFSIEHVYRKFNKEADTLSKTYIYGLFTQEKEHMMENSFHYGHKDISFLQMPEMQYSFRGTSHDVVTRVYHALKRKYTFLTLDEINENFEIFNYIDGQKNILEKGNINSKNHSIDNLIQKFRYFSKDVRGVINVTLIDTYHQMIGFSLGINSPKLNKNLHEAAEKMQELYIYYEKPKCIERPKKTKSLKTEIQNLSPEDAVQFLKKNQSKRTKQMIISIYIDAFKEQFNRSPKHDEIKAIVNSVQS